MIEGFRGEYKFLSNFHMVDIEVDGIVYKSVEHYYVCSKFIDDQMIDNIWYDKNMFIEYINSIDLPGKVKRIGSKIKVRSDWNKVKLDIMYKGLVAKYNVPELKKLLLDTKNQEIIEVNNWNDRYWGVCDGVGKNKLGKMLMDIRSELRHVSLF